MKRKILIGLLIFFAVLLVGGYIFLKSSFMTDRIRGTLESVLRKQLRREVSVGKVTGDILSGISISNISVAKNEKLSEGKLAEIKEVTAGYSLLSLLRWKLVIKDVLISQPRIWIERDENGKLNLPEFAAAEEKPGAEKGESRFSVLISKLNVFSGEIYFDDKQSSIRSSITGMNVRVKGNGREMEYSGRIRADRMDVDVQGVSKTIFNLASSFETTAESVKISDLSLQLGRSDLKAEATVLIAEPPTVSAEIELALYLEDLSEFVTQLDRFEGKAEISAAVSGTVPEIAGMCKLDIPLMLVNDLEVRNLNAEAEFTPSQVNLNNLSLLVDKGAAELAGIVQLADGKISRYDGRLIFRDLDVGGIMTAVNRAESPISGHLSGEISAYGTDFLPENVNMDGQLELADSSLKLIGKPKDKKEAPPSIDVPIGTAQASLSAKDGAIALKVSRDKTILNMEGNLSNEGDLKLSAKLDGIDAGEITSLLSASTHVESIGSVNADASMKIIHPAFRAAFGLPPADLPSGFIEGIADLKARVDLSMPDLSIPVDPAQEDVRIGSLAGTMNLVNDRLRIEKISLRLDESEFLIATADVQIADVPVVDANLTIDSLNIENYLPLAGSGELPLSGGTLNGKLDVRGTTLDMNGSGQFLLTGLSVGPRKIDQISIPINIKSSVLNIPNLLVSSDGEQIALTLGVKPSGDYNLQIDSSPIDLSKMATADVPVRGTAHISVSGSGNINSPSLEGRLELNKLGYNSDDLGEGLCVFSLKDKRAHVDFSLSEQKLIATLDSGIEPPFPFNAIIQMGNMNLEPALKIAGLHEKLDLQIAGNIDLYGEGADPMNASVDGVLQTVLLDAEGLRWTNDMPLVFEFKRGKGRLGSMVMKGQGGQLSVKGGFDVAGAIDMDASVRDLNLAAVSKLVALPKPVAGKLNCAVKVGGEVSSPLMEMTLDVSGVSYDQVGVDKISALVSYKDKAIQVEKFVLNTFGGEVRLKATLPVDLNLLNPPTPDKIKEGSLHASLDAENIDLSFAKPFAPQLASIDGEIDDAHFEISGRIMQPKIGGSLRLKNGALLLETIPVPIENLNGILSLESLETRELPSLNGFADGLSFIQKLGTDSSSSDQAMDYEASLNLGWEMAEGKYSGKGSIKIPRSFLDSLLDTSIQGSEPDFRFDLNIQNGQFGSIVKSMAKTPIPPFDGMLSGKLHLDGSIPYKQLQESPMAMVDAVRANLIIDSFGLSLNDHQVRNRGPLEFSFADKTLNISNFQLVTSAPSASREKVIPDGSISMSGKMIMDDTFEFNLSGDRLNAGLFSSLLQPPIKVGGDIGFSINAGGRLDSPSVAFSLLASDLNLPIASTSGETKIDAISCKISYNNNLLSIEEFHVDTFGNKLDVNGSLPVSVSLMPTAISFPDQEMDLRMMMDNFDLAFLNHLNKQIEEVNGNVAGNMRIFGSFKVPRLTGKFELLDASCRLMIDNSKMVKTGAIGKPQPIEIQGFNVKVSMDDNGIFMDDLSFQIGEGKYDARGKLAMDPGLKPKLFDFVFKADPAQLDPFLNVIGQDLTSSVSGNIAVSGELKGDIRELRGKPPLDMLKVISGEVLIPDEGIKIDASGNMISNPKEIRVKFQDGNLSLNSLRLVDKTAGDKRASSISAFGDWDIGGEMSFDATLDIDMSLVSEFMKQPEFMTGWLGFRIRARGQKVECVWPWPPPENGVEESFTVGHATIDKFQGTIVYENQKITVGQLRVLSGGNDIVFSGSIPMTEEKMVLRLDGKLDDMGILSFLNRDITESSGRGNIGATITGNMPKILAKEEPPQFVGFCQFSNLNANFAESYMDFEDIEANIEFDSQKLGKNRGFVRLGRLSGKMNGGQFALSSDPSVQSGAEIIWDEKNAMYKVGQLSNISIMMKDCKLEKPLAYSMLFNGELSLGGSFDAPIITGDVSVSQGEYVESLDSFVQKLFSSREIGVRAFLDYPLVQDLELDVSIQIPGNMRMKNSLLEVEAKASARVRGSLVEPIVMAQASIVEGEFSYFGRKFNITKGEITNRAKIDPSYDILAETQVTNTEAGGTDSGSTLTVKMELKGSLSEFRPPVFMVSGAGVAQDIPNWSQTDIISILTLGNTPEAFLAGGGTGSSTNLLMEPAKWYLESQAEKLLNLKDFQIQIDPNDSKQTRLLMATQLMKQISVLVDVGYSGQKIGLQYDMTKHFAIAGELSQEDWGLDLKIKTDFP